MMKYSSQPPFCLAKWRPVISDEYVVVPIHAYHAYDSVTIYAQALTESLADGYDPRNGTSVMERIRNRRYRSVLGYDVSQIFRFLY
jgi:guanylate cyclase